MKKFKKRLITGLSLGLSAITVGAIVSSCASSATQATDPNPASANSISTNPGDPLTPEQQDYQQKLAAEIKVQFDANAKLDYSAPADKANIDSQITKYENELNSGAVGSLISAYGKLDKTSATFQQDLTNLYINFYNESNFNQKNLLPPSKLMQEIFNYSNDPTINAKNIIEAVWASIEIFFSNPKAIILLIQCHIKKDDIDIKNPLSFDNSYFFIAFQSSMAILNISINETSKNSSFYNAEQYYNSMLINLFPDLTPPQGGVSTKSNYNPEKGI